MENTEIFNDYRHEYDSWDDFPECTEVEEEEQRAGLSQAGSGDRRLFSIWSWSHDPASWRCQECGQENVFNSVADWLRKKDQQVPRGCVVNNP